MLLLDVDDADKVEMLYTIFRGVPEANIMFVQEYANAEQGEGILCSAINTKLQGLVYAYTQGVGSQPQDGGKGGQTDPIPAPKRKQRFNEDEKRQKD